MIRYPRFLVLVAFSLMLVIFPAAPVVAQEATPATECVATTPEENEALAVRYWEEAVWGPQGKIAEIVAPDEIHHWGIGGQTTGFEEFAERWALFNAAFPDLEFTVDLIAAEGDLVGTYWTAHGSQRGEWQGIAPTGREVTWSGINIFRIACGQIIESWGEADHLSLRQQLGATDVPAAMAIPATPAAATGVVATPCADDTPAANLAVARRWTEEVFNKQNVDVLDEILAADAVHHGAAFPDTHGREAIKEALARQFAAFPDMALTVDLAIADGDMVMVRWSGPATQEGAFLGLEPTGAPVELTGINVYRLACGTIVEGWSEMNVLQVFQELQGASGMATPASS
jgi:predicted ester cyclase